MQDVQVDLFSLIKNMADSFVNKEIRVGEGKSFMPPGHNGPYYDVETPIRNTSHWLVVYCKLYVVTGECIYRDLAYRLANFLMEPGQWIKKGIYIHRQKHGKDWCNGVIGQAWVIESLNLASSVLQRPELKEHALRAARAFPYDKRAGAWIKIDPRNNKKAVDYTLNHQTWFAATVAELGDASLDDSVNHYLEGLSKGGMRVCQDGVIRHLLYKSTLKGLLLRMRYLFSEVRFEKKIREKEVGYHLFNLHPFARLYNRFPDHVVFQGELFKRALQVITENGFMSELKGSSYAYPYNAPAFEYPLICKTFQIDLPSEVLEVQVSQYYDLSEGGFVNCPDHATLNARAYEAL